MENKKLTVAVYSLITVASLSVSVLFIYYILNSNPSGYNSYITYKNYFSFCGGYVYTAGDTIKISKNSEYNDLNFEVRNLITDKIVREKASDLKCDLSGIKFNELQRGTVTDKIVLIESGIYVFILRSGNLNLYQNVLFVNEKNDNPEINIVLSDNTWICYNEFGGRSNYRDSITPGIIKTIDHFRNRDCRYLYNLSMYRPISINNEETEMLINDNYEIKESRIYHCVVSEIPLIKLLFEKYRKNFKITDCIGFENAAVSGNNKLFIFNGHSEYWTGKMMGRLNILKASSNILFFSGNNIFREVSRNGENLTVTRNKIPKEITTKLTGTFYRIKDFTNSSAFRIIDTDNFLFEGITSTEIGGYKAASIETDAINEYTDGTFELLASGISIDCDIVLQTNNNNKYLLNTSSIGSYNGLKEENFRKFITNYIDVSLK